MTDDKDKLAQMLEQASPEMMVADPIVRKAFSVALLASDLYVPVHQSEDEQAADGGVSLQAIDIDGALHVLLFSSKDKLGAFMGGSTRFARAPGRDILPSLRGGHAVLNPGEKGRVLAPEDITEILGEPSNPKHGHTGHVHGPDCNH